MSTTLPEHQAVTMDPQDEEALLADVAAFCEEISPIEELCYLEHRFNSDAIELGKKYNLFGIPVPKEYGGRGADLRAYMKALVMFGRVSAGVRTLFSAHSSIGQKPVIGWGNEQQKQKYLTASSKGEKIMAFGLTEPDAGSNPVEMTTTYRREGDHFLLNGVKYLISNGGIAHTVVVFAYPEEGGRISAFIVDTDGEGFEKEDLTAKLGLPTSNTAMFELSDYKVPVENLLGEEGEGFRVAMGTLTTGRLSVAASCLGAIEDCLKEAMDYAKSRNQHGKPIAKHQLVQDHIAHIEVARYATESLLNTAVDAYMASEADPGNAQLAKQADLYSAETKFFAANAACDAADRAIQVFGGRGFSELFRPGRHWKDIRVCRLYEGTDEIIKLKIAGTLLGKEYQAFK